MENAPIRDAEQAAQFHNVLDELEKTIDRVARGVQGEDHPLIDGAQDNFARDGLYNQEDVENDDDDVTIQPKSITNGVSMCGAVG